MSIEYPFEREVFGEANDADLYTEIFPVCINSVVLSGSTYLYDWTEQTFNPVSGNYTDADNPRQGNTSTGPFMRSIDNQNVMPPFFTWARLRGIVAGQPLYEFGETNVTTVSGGSGMLTFRDKDAAQINGNIISVQMDGDGVLTANVLGSGSVQYALTPAQRSQAGVVIGGRGSPGEQVWDGFKDFSDYIYCLNSNGINWVPTSGSAGVPVGQTWQAFMTAGTSGSSIWAIHNTTGYGARINFIFGSALRYEFGCDAAQPTTPPPCYTIKGNDGNRYDGIYGTGVFGNTFAGGICTALGAAVFEIKNGNGAVIDAACVSIKGDSRSILTFTDLTAGHVQMLIADASSVSGGVVNTSGQTFAGAKTFLGDVTVPRLFLDATASLTPGADRLTTAVNDSLLSGSNPNGAACALVEVASGSQLVLGFGQTADAFALQVTPGVTRPGIYHTDPFGNQYHGGLITASGAIGATYTDRFGDIFTKGILTTSGSSLPGANGVDACGSTFSAGICILVGSGGVTTSFIVPSGIVAGINQAQKLITVTKGLITAIT